MHTTIIAEVGVNHNQDLERALEMIDVASGAGADMVKFQAFKAEHLASRFAPKAEYQKRTTERGESQLDMIRKLGLDWDGFPRLMDRCRDRGVGFLVSPFDLPSIDFLVRDLGLDLLKVPSGELTFGPYLLAVGRSGRKIIVSTGMSTLAEVEQALGVLAFGYTESNAEPSAEAFKAAFGSPAGQGTLKDKVVLLHCTTEYPTPFEDVNLRAMDTLSEAFGLPVGLSDHTPGIAVPIAAAARGAVTIEKHFTLDRGLPGPDHKASLEPDELKAMVEGVRAVEEALGSGVKEPAASEIKNTPIARKSLVAARTIGKGEAFTDENVTAKRPGSGMSPMRFWELLGRLAERDYGEDEILDEDAGTES